MRLKEAEERWSSEALRGTVGKHYSVTRGIKTAVQAWRKGTLPTFTFPRPNKN